ncbi:unnamed protein product [Meloidogyne enterolobii]|uniref:Uncharacterized protein n=1 Tax=Meloidogyne enterolobii TaxID=390850 RepID=A0ACB0XQ63_MELEN
MLVSMSFVFCSLLELAIVGFKVREKSGGSKKNSGINGKFKRNILWKIY